MLSWKNVRNAQNSFSAEYATPIWDVIRKKSNLAKVLGQMVQLSQKFIIFMKNLLKNTPCVAIVMHDEWMKEWFSKSCIHTVKEHILYLVICQS